MTEMRRVGKFVVLFFTANLVRLAQVRVGKHDEDLRFLGVCDPHLGAIDDIAGAHTLQEREEEMINCEHTTQSLSTNLGRGLQREGVRSRARLRQTERSQRI